MVQCKKESVGNTMSKYKDALYAVRYIILGDFLVPCFRISYMNRMATITAWAILILQLYIFHKMKKEQPEVYAKQYKNHFIAGLCYIVGLKTIVLGIIYTMNPMMNPNYFYMIGKDIPNTFGFGNLLSALIFIAFVVSVFMIGNTFNKNAKGIQ